MHITRQISLDKNSRWLYGMVVHLFLWDFWGILTLNFLRNLPVRDDNMNRADNIFCKDIVYLQGKYIRRTPSSAITNIIVIPPKKSLYNQVDRTTYIIFVNKLPFYLSLYQVHTFSTV